MLSSWAYSPPPPPPPPVLLLPIDPPEPAPPPPPPHASALLTTVTPAGHVQLLDPTVVNSAVLAIDDGPGCACNPSGPRAEPMMPGRVCSAPRVKLFAVDVATACAWLINAPDCNTSPPPGSALFHAVNTYRLT